MSGALLLLLLATPGEAAGPDKAAASEAPKARAKLSDNWNLQPYLRPLGGVSIFSSSQGTQAALSLGLTGGVRYWERADGPDSLLGVPLFGNARAKAEYLTNSSDINGLEMRLGNFIGPWFDPVGLQTGPDFFWSRYQWGALTLDPTFGLAWPVMAIAQIDFFHFYTGVEPAWYFNPDRPRVDWSNTDALGFGHEFSWFVGTALHLGSLRLSVSWNNRQTALGVQRGLGVGLRVGG